jgi:hypothetical protein
MMVVGLPTMGIPRYPKADFRLPSTISSRDCALRCDLCLYSAMPPMTPEDMRNFARIMPPGPGRDRAWRDWKDKGITAVASIFEINTDFFKTGR